MPGVNSQSRITRPFVYRGESIRAPAENPSSVRKPRSQGAAEERLALTDPTVRVVTDFVWEQPVTVPAELAIDDALRGMIRVRVRALLTDTASSSVQHGRVGGAEP